MPLECSEIAIIVTVVHWQSLLSCVVHSTVREHNCGQNSVPRSESCQTAQHTQSLTVVRRNVPYHITDLLGYTFHVKLGCSVRRSESCQTAQHTQSLTVVHRNVPYHITNLLGYTFHVKLGCSVRRSESCQTAQHTQSTVVGMFHTISLISLATHSM